MKNRCTKIEYYVLERFCTCVKKIMLIRAKKGLRPATLLKRDSNTDVFREIYKIFKTTYFYRTSLKAASKNIVLKSLNFNLSFWTLNNSRFLVRATLVSNLLQMNFFLSFDSVDFTFFFFCFTCLIIVLSFT